MKLVINKGDRYGKLTIIKEEQYSINNQGKKIRYFSCKCECGQIKTIYLTSLRSGNTRSCGCLFRKHLMEGTRIYRTYINIGVRCNNIRSPKYKNYGGRGIKCEWNSFEEFYKDMGESYEKHLKQYGQKNTTIDRIDNNGNYCKENCRWATCKEQQRNKRSNVLYKGKCISEWCEELGINYNQFFYRYVICNKNISNTIQYFIRK